MAATDADKAYPYDAGAGASVLESQWRAMARWWVTSGPIRLEDIGSFTAATTGARSISVDAGRCWIEGAFGEFTGATTVSFATNTSGNTRIDLVVLRNDFTANKIQMDVLQGTPSGTPVAPTPTQNSAKWEVPLWQVSCANNFTAILAGNITDVRKWAQGRPPGGPTLIACKSIKSTTQAISHDLETALTFADFDEYDAGNLHNPASNSTRFNVIGGCTGLWSVSANVTWGTVTDDFIRLILYVNGSRQRTLYSGPKSDNDTGPSYSGYREQSLAAGDYMEVFVYRFGDGTHTTRDIVRAECSVRFLGYLT